MEGCHKKSRRDKSAPNKCACRTFQLFAGSNKRTEETEGVKPGRWPQRVSPSTKEVLCLFTKTKAETGWHYVLCITLSTIFTSCIEALHLKCEPHLYDKLAEIATPCRLFKNKTFLIFGWGTRTLAFICIISRLFSSS